MKTVCKKHSQAFELGSECPWCEPVFAAPKGPSRFSGVSRLSQRTAGLVGVSLYLEGPAPLGAQYGMDLLGAPIAHFPGNSRTCFLETYVGENPISVFFEACRELGYTPVDFKQRPQGHFAASHVLLSYNGAKLGWSHLQVDGKEWGHNLCLSSLCPVPTTVYKELIDAMRVELMV